MSTIRTANKRHKRATTMRARSSAAPAATAKPTAIEDTQPEQAAQ